MSQCARVLLQAPYTYSTPPVPIFLRFLIIPPRQPDKRASAHVRESLRRLQGRDNQPPRPPPAAAAPPPRRPGGKGGADLAALPGAALIMRLRLRAHLRRPAGGRALGSSRNAESPPRLVVPTRDLSAERPQVP